MSLEDDRKLQLVEEWCPEEVRPRQLNSVGEALNVLAKLGRRTIINGASLKIFLYFIMS